ncbi:unnamed protein product [Urochloa humidicola]
MLVSPTVKCMPWNGAGSRFWALSTEESSDDEDEEVTMEGEKTPNPGGDARFFRDATFAGFSVDELKRAEIMAASGASPTFCSVDAGGGQAKRPRTLARRIVDAVAERRTLKKWKGPLPQARSSPPLSLGDIWVKDARSGRNKRQSFRFGDLGETQKSPASFPAPEGGKRRSDLDPVSNFESQERVTIPVGLAGPKSWADINLTKAQAGKVFRCEGGLGMLFKRAGKPGAVPKTKRSHLLLRRLGSLGKNLEADPSVKEKEQKEKAEKVIELEEGERDKERHTTMWKQNQQGRGGMAQRGRPGERRASDDSERQRALGRQDEGRFGGGRFNSRGRGFEQGPYRSGGSFGGGRPGRGQQGFERHHNVNRRLYKEVASHPGGSSSNQYKGKEEGQVNQHYKTVGGDAEMTEADGDEAVDGSESQTGIKCGRCTKKGHLAANCTNEVYCVICDKHDHMNFKCPLLKMPRPVAHAVGYAVHGLGFYHIPHPPLSKAKKDAKMALISVEGGALSQEQLVEQLQRIFPGKWKWELKEEDELSFIAEFPSKVELQRAVAFGGADAKGEGIPVGVRIKFDKWQVKEEGYLLPKVWVRVHGIRKELREFLELWAVGSILGSTQTVDMETTRNNDFGRIFVAVLNPKLIPVHRDVVIGDHYFELRFEVEKLGVNELGEEAEVHWNGDSEEGDRGAEEEDWSEQERSPKRKKDDRETEKGLVFDKRGGGAKNASSFESLKERIQNMSKEEFNLFIRKKAEEVLDISVDKVLGEIADKVMEETEDVQSSDRRASETESQKEGRFNMEVSGGLQVDSLQDDLSGNESLLKKKAAIPEMMISPTRSSPRLQNSKSEHTLARAEGRAAKRNLEHLKGNLQSNALDSNLGNSFERGSEE